MALIAEIFAARQQRRERRYRDPLDPLNVSDEDLLRYYRFPRQEIISLCEELRPHIERRTRRSHAIPTHTQVLMTLRFLASGSFQNIIGDSSGVTQASVSRVIEQVTNVLHNKAIAEVKMPTSVIDINRTEETFYRISGFPRVIDGTHIPIKAPTENEHIFVNRKSVHSLNLQVVVDAENLITSYSVKYPGSTHDAFIWNNCPLKHRFQSGRYRDTHLLGDSGYPLEPFLLTPFLNPGTRGEERYNRSHKQTRVIVEQTFGILKSRFRCIHSSGGSLQYHPRKCAKIAAAYMLLHNRCVRRRIPVPELLEDREELEDRIDEPQGAHGNRGQRVRAEIVENYFA